MAETPGVYGQEVLDSRGNPTAEVEVTARVDGLGQARSSPGALTASFEGSRVARWRRCRRCQQGKGAAGGSRPRNDELAEGDHRSADAEDQRGSTQHACGDGTNNSPSYANAGPGCSSPSPKAASISTGRQVYAYLGGAQCPCLLPTPMMDRATSRRPMQGQQMWTSRELMIDARGRPPLG